MDVCYRHPDRETGVACSNCGRPICPDCMTSTPVGMRCPECARQRTKVKTMATVETPTLTYVLIGICVALALGSMLSSGDSVGGDDGSLIRDFALSRATVGDGEVWRLVTAGFLHAGLLHLLFNMYALYILGSMLEPGVGRVRFALIYFVSLLAGSFGALLLQETGYTVGASGAIFGLMGAAVVIMRNRGIDPMESGLGLWIGLNLLITFTIPGISIGGHIGGLVGGALVAAVLYDGVERFRIPSAAATLIAGAIGVASVAGALAVAP
ncbi:MAG TPA: rhomboid family intramembrane serine protease [Thermoleophilaceae bacterium]|jgi:membrane associated rhomboid family serine protease